MSVKVKESIRHGDYSNERVVDIPDLTKEHVAAVLNTSPYRNPVDRTAGDPVVERIADELSANGRSHLGWAEYIIL